MRFTMSTSRQPKIPDPTTLPDEPAGRDSLPYWVSTWGPPENLGDASPGQDRMWSL